MDAQGSCIIERIKPRYIQCLFSYIMFFLLLEDAYHTFYRCLNGLNRAASLSVKHDKEPKPPALYGKVKLIRNKAIAHYGGGIPRDADPDSLVALQWDFGWSLADRDSIRLEDMWFGGIQLGLVDTRSGKTEKSKNRRIGPIGKIHESLSEYLADFDRVCAEYLRGIRAKLPKVVNSVSYGTLPR